LGKLIFNIFKVNSSYLRVVAILFLNNLTSIFLASLISSCAVEEYIDIPNTGEQKIVVFSIISPGDSLFVEVNYSTNLNEWTDSQTSRVSDAIVTLHNEEGKSTALTFDQNRSIYFGSQENLPIEAGKIYILKIATQKGETLIATCQVPEASAVWSNLTKTKIVEAGIEFFRINGTWDGLPESPGYTVFIESTDELENGITYSRKYEAKYWEISRVQNYYSFQRLLPSNTLVRADFSLITMDSNLHSFNLATIPYKEFIDLNRADIINSFKGVYPAYTNIEGGVGVFGAYLRDTLSIKF